MSYKKNNTGSWNTGDRNTGRWNAGDCNTGSWNKGDRNIGSWNAGDCNTGDCNTGNWNTGDRNTGRWNAGSWNTGNWNTGYCNTNEPEVRIFNKYTKTKKEDIIFPNFFHFEVTFWINESEMTQEEKNENTDYKICGGYLKNVDYKDAWRKSWDKADKTDRDKLFKLPNFDAEIFKEISGIDVTKDDDLERKKKELIKKANELLKQAEEL